MAFALRKLHGKCVVQHQDFYTILVDLTRAFNTMATSELWNILLSLWYPPNFLAVIQAFNNGMAYQYPLL